MIQFCLVCGYPEKGHDAQDRAGHHRFEAPHMLCLVPLRSPGWTGSGVAQACITTETPSFRRRVSHGG